MSPPQPQPPVASTPDPPVPAWLRGIPRTPEYRPTESEFADPITFLSRVEREAAAYGICKVILPYPRPSRRFVFAHLNRSLVTSSDGPNPTTSDASNPTSSTPASAAVFTTRPRTRNYGHVASAVDPLHLKYFIFSGRVIGLALMHRVQVGIVLDRTLFLHLAVRSITLEDIAVADPVMYASCKRILEMGAAEIDELTLTFSREVHELGSRRTIEFYPGGQDIFVNTTNREHYIDLLIKNIFMDPISIQLAHFAQGFSDILLNPELQKVFFECLDLEDFDRMLGGSNNTINLKDWKSHTQYNGYEEEDCHIIWFWKAVERKSRLRDAAARQQIQWTEDSSQSVDPTTPVQTEQGIPLSTPPTQETLTVVASGPGSAQVVASTATCLVEGKLKASSSPSDCSLQTSSKPNNPALADVVGKKLSSSFYFLQILSYFVFYRSVSTGTLLVFIALHYMFNKFAAIKG